MVEMVIDNSLVVDDVESVLSLIRGLSGKRVEDFGVVKKFINRESNTIFYLDSNLNSSLQQQEKNVYAWLDTGFTDYYGNPIFLSLLRGNEGYAGHFVGTVETLVDNVRSYFGISRNVALQKMGAFERKYSTKIQNRRVRHIEDEQQYLFDCLNQYAGTSVIAEKLHAAGVHFENSDTESDSADLRSEENGASGNMNSDMGMTKIEEEITLGLLLERMEEMQKYMDELVDELQKVSSESEARIRELQEKNAEYKRAILQMREFTGNMAEEPTNTGTENEGVSGHDLLGKHGKILVIGGQKLGVNVMLGIAKTMGFEKGDFDFVDYDKVNIPV